MNKISKYIFDWCSNLLTEDEREARKHLIGLQKVQNAESEKMKNASKRFWLSTKENVLKLLEDGEENFYKKTVERVLRENSDKRFLNFCPKCNALTRTPKSKQCRKCFYSWHNETK